MPGTPKPEENTFIITKKICVLLCFLIIPLSKSTLPSALGTKKYPEYLRNHALVKEGIAISEPPSTYGFKMLYFMLLGKRNP